MSRPSGFFLPILAGVFAYPLGAGGRGDGEMLRVVQLNAGDGFRDRRPLEDDADPCPVGATIGGMKECPARTARPDIIAEGGNRAELDATRDMDLLEGFPGVRRALHFALR